MKKTLSNNTLNLIEEYKHLPTLNIQCPYYNNKRVGLRAGLRALIGKGSPTEIVEEATMLAMQKKIQLGTLSKEELKKFLVDNNLGIDCSGFAYHVLNAEKSLKLHYNGGFLKKLKSMFRPAEQTSVKVFADESNSTNIKPKDIQPGDMIIMVGIDPNETFHHILIITEVHYEKETPTHIIYTHSLKWSSDGQYNHGVRDGNIKITQSNGSLLDQEWTEQEKTDEQNETLTQAKNAKQLLLKRLT